MSESRDAITPEVADELRAMYAIARTVRGGTPLDDPKRKASIDFAAALQSFIEQGVSAYRLAQVIGARPGAIRQRLARHGYRAPMPSAAHKAYRHISTGRAGQ